MIVLLLIVNLAGLIALFWHVQTVMEARDREDALLLETLEKQIKQTAEALENLGEMMNAIADLEAESGRTLKKLTGMIENEPKPK